MPNKVTYTITTSDGKEHQVSKENVDKYGIQSYADAYKGATIRMRDAQKGDYDIPLQHFDNARKQGLHAFSLEHMPVQKQAAPKPTPSPSVHPQQSTPQGSKPLLSDSFGKGTDFLKPKPVGYNLSEEHRNEVLGEQAKRSATPSNPHVQRAIQLGNEAKTKRVEREQKRFGKPTIAKAFDDAVHGDKKAAKELGMPQVMQQKKDELDYMQATGKELRNPVDAGLTYDENGDVVHSMFAPTVARDEHGNIVTNEVGEPLVGISSDEARAKAYGDSVQTGIEAQREKDKVDNLYKDAVESVNDAFDEDYKKKEAFRKEHPFLGAVSDALEGFSNRGNALQYVPEGAKPGLAALGMLSKAAIAKNNADRYGDAGTLSRLYGGIMAGLTDVDTYDFGITDTFNAANLYRAAKNYEEGKATAKDKMLLDAAAIANNVQSEASDKLGGAFGAGQNLVRTFGFMMQMISNPASGTGKDAAASVAKTVAKRALQKFGKGAIAKAVTGLAKGATRVGMDAVEAGVVTGMYSPTKIVGDYLNRKTGDVQSDGKGGYIFQNKEYSDVKALAKAINGQYAENISEMWGEYLPGVGKVNAAIGRGARKIGLGKVVDAFEHMSSSNWAKTWKNFQERTKWNGMAGEYFEEVANNLYNAVTNGDMTLNTDPHTGVFNPKINRDTFYSVALMSGIMSGVNTAGYARERYKAPHEQRKADAQARSVFGERWDEYKNAIDNADEKQIGSVMEKIGSDKSLSNSQKIAALQYQYRTAVVHGVNAQDTKNKLEGQFNAMDEAYSMGYNLQDEKELNNTAILYDEAKKQATKATGWGEDTLESMIGEDGGVSTLAYMKHSDEFNDGQLQAFINYANARAAYNGMIQRVKDDIDTKVHESNLEVEQRTNLNTGAIHPATMKVDNRQVYVVNGNVVMLPDGSGVDHEHSDDFVVLRDAKTGKLEQADPSAISKVDTPINAQEEKGIAADNIRQTFAQQQADKIDGKLEFKQGDTYSIINKEDGTQHSLSIIGDAIDEKTGQVNPEMVLVDIDGAQQPILLPKEQVQQQVDEARRAAVAATQVVESAPTTNTNNTYSINDEVTLSDENGNAVRGSITAPENEDGKFEVYTEQPINGKKVNLFSAEELDAITKAPETVAENATVQQPQQQEDTEESVEKETPKQQPTALERIPKDESGQPLYEQAEPETAWDAIVEQTEGDTSMAQAVADDMVSDLEAGVKKAEKTKTKSGGSIAEKIAAEKERAAVIEQAKATLAHWRKIAAVNRMREAAIHAEENRKAEEAARLRKEQEDKERAEQEEAERIKREALNGVPDFVEDKASDARARGYRRVNGDKVDRQEPLAAVQGKEVQVKFDDDNIPTGHVAIIEANQLQPSHKNGQRNPQHFIDEAQPKERKDDASVGAARKIAANIRPEEITSSVTAYTGAPTVNSRGEVIQGNNRSAALREMWDNHQEQGDKYKKYLMDNAESFGLRAEDIAAMDKPVLVNMLNVNDEDAIALGQFVASDTESGGTERIKPKNVVKKLGDKMKNFANILLRANDENISFAELVDSNGVDALKWLNANGIISPTQYKSAFDSKGNITAEAKNDIKGIMYQSIFEGGSTQLEEMFNTMPTKAQKAVLATAYRDYDNPKSERMVEEIQNSIMAYYALSHDAQFMAATNHKDARMAVEAWKRQYAIDDNTGESYLPAEKYSNFALLLATMYKGDNQSFIQGTFNKMYDLIQGTQEETLFEQPDNTPRSLVQAIKETLNIEYNGQQRSNVLAGDSSASQEGRTGSNGDATPRGRSENIDGAEANQGGTERESTAEPQPIGQGEFGPIYDQFKGKANEAVEFLLRKKNGEAIAALHHKDIGDIDLVWGKAGTAHSDGFGLAKLSMYHPEVISNLQEILDDMVVTSRTDNRVQLESEKYQATVRLTWDNEKKTWLLTMFEKKNSALSNTTDTDKTHKGNGNDTATPESTVISESKDKQSSDTKQENVDNYLEKPTKSEDLFAMAERVAAEDKAKRTRKKEEAKVDTNPTEAQKEAGNYRKGHIKVDGMDITIEQPKGSVRRGKDVNGKEWETEMHNTYGYIRGTESVDGDHINIFLSDTPETGNVFVINQVNKDGSFDEHKVMYGFSDMESAKKAYLSNYEDGWQGLGNITEVSKEEFKKWIDSSKRKTKSFAEYSSVKTEGDVRVEHPIESSERTKPEAKNRLVTDERYEELKKRMKAKLRGQLNMGVDPEMLAIGAEMAVYHIESGARAFSEYAKEMISNLGDAIRPYLKAFYNGARDLPEMAELSKEMTSYSDVSAFDVATIGNEGEEVKPTVFDTAEQVSNEATVEHNAQEEAKQTTETGDVDNDVYTITKQHNNKKDVENQDNKSEEEIVSKEKVRKAINAYEDAREKFDNLFSPLVKEKESKPFDSREWREVNRTEEELKDVLLQLNTKELGELLKQVSGKETEYVIKNVLDIVNRQEHRLIAFNAILDKQSHITPEYKEEKKAIPVSEFVETDKKRAETHTILTGVFHDKGYVVGTDAYLLLARKEDYDKSLEGKVTNKKGEVINGKYPNWRAVVNNGKQGKSWGVNLEELHAFTRGVLTKLKTEKANPSTKKDAKIAFKTADGKIVLCYANVLDKALQGAKSIGAKSFFDNDDVFAITQTPKGYVICPILNQDQNIDDNSFAYVPRVSELQHSTETLSNDTEAKQLATDTILSALNKAGIEVVRATDEQAQELLANTHATSLRTPQGTIYGWSANGKIYLTEAGINPDTPIHEYTHLWVEAMMSKNKKGWNNIKALLKETPVWNEVVADPSYSNITNNEDAVASEVLSRISGSENAARIVSEAQKVIDEAEGVLEKAKATTILLNIKEALRNFWEWIGKNVFKMRSFSSIDEVTDKILYDLVNATRLNANKNKSIIGDDNIEIETAERDKQYLEAVQRGDMDTARRLVNEAAERNGYTSNSDYQGTSAFNGAAPYGNGYFFSREKRKEAYENDEFDGNTSLDDYINSGIDPMNLDFLTSDSSYRHADDARKEAIENLRNVIKNKRQAITMYRSVPSSVKEGSFRNGDWITPSYAYAVENARVHGWGRDFRIIEQEVPIDEVWFDGNDIAEFGYGNEDDFINDKDYLYSNTKNNRKLPDVVTYDDNGNIIPLSKRFNKLKGDPRFQIKKDALSANDAARSHAFEKEVNEQRAAEEPLFNVSSSIRSFTEGNLFSEVDFSDSPNKNVNQAISKLTDDELLKEIAKGDSKEWNFYMEEYDRRHNKEFQEAVERYMNSLEDEKTSLDTAYGSYVNVAKNWSNGGYHTTERTLLRAQLDAIEDYVGRKENEQLSSVESEAYHQAKETVRKVGYDLTRLRLRPLEEGEVCHVERRYTESNGFSFTGKEHVESIEDIAYIFKQLETSSVENSFLVLIKDGTPTVLHLSIGSYATTLAPIEQAIVAADAINPDKVLFVHNHPSGNISASKQDMDVQKKIKEVFGGKVMPAIIINTTSGKFGMFSEDGRLEDGNIPLPDEHNNIPINVYQFSQQVFAKDWNPEFAFRVVGPESIAEYVSSHRLGEHKKMSLIILDQAGHITGNVFLPWTKLTDVDSHKNIMQIISYVNQMGGRSAILYGNYELGEDTRDTNKSIFKIKTAFSNSGLHLMDVINIDDSAHDRGAMEEDVEYGKRYLDEEKLREGYGSYTNGELSFINDPVAKMLGKNNRTEEDHKAFAERERQRMMSRISELADRLHLDNVEVVTDSNGLQGKKAKAKGFYSKSSGKITIVIPNHSSVEDVEKTLLHEAVAHYGLRKLFGEHFETFLDNVYQNVEPEIRRIITSQAANNNWDFRTATEEYLAGLAERTDFERVHYAIWNKIKSLFLKMLHSVGFEGWSATELSDNELRYLLWRSYENMKEPGRYRSILGEAEDIAKQNELKVGNYNQQDTDSSNVAERGILYREDDSNEKKQVNAREKYEQRVNRAMFQTQEALQDSMLALKEAMNAITKAEGKNVNIEDIDGYENAYLGENRLSSVNKAEADAFAHLLFKPMLAEVSKICKNAQERAELVDYMMAKHGLERNAVMRKRAIEDILNNEKLSDAQKSARAGLAEYRDYAGLTALTGKDDVTEAEVDAEVMVSEYENTHDTTNLWDKVNAVNAAILSKSYECGMMDKETYEKISDMYKYYIPLRGFDETTSEEAYAYLLHQNNAFNAPIKVAKGRSSKADDPFANMQSMAESAITQGNRNKLVKQRFFNFVLNHPSDLVSISDMWLKYDDVADEWKPVFPDNFEENDSAEDIEQKLKEFEDKMKKLAEQAPDKYKHGKETANIPYRVVDSRDLRQHQVLVKRGGRDYVLTLNGNPRAAQALNGQTNPDNDTSGAIGAILKAGEMVNRQLSAFYTTRNPDFVVSNFIRDMLFSNSIVWVKENPNYALRFHRNIARCNPAQIKVLLAKHRKGTLDMNNKLEHMFYQFMMNGGETGYANVRDIEQHKNDIRRELKRANGKLSITKAFNLLGEKLDEYNRAVENCARFAAYLTSREMGRTVERSIYDAKEISVNFNKKGSGAKFMNAVGQTKIGTASAFVSGIGRSGFVFWNAAIQGTTNFGRQFKKHPAKAFTASAIMFLLGAVIAGIGMGTEMMTQMQIVIGTCLNM